MLGILRVYNTHTLRADRDQYRGSVEYELVLRGSGCPWSLSGGLSPRSEGPELGGVQLSHTHT